MPLIRCFILTGSPYFTIDNNSPDPKRMVQYFNSALLISPEGKMTDRYSKQHLVPFGEYVPLARYLTFLEPLVVHVGDFSPGLSSKPMGF